MYFVYLETGVSVEANSQEEATQKAREKFKEMFNNNEIMEFDAQEERDTIPCNDCHYGEECNYDLKNCELHLPAGDRTGDCLNWYDCPNEID
jgi:hypothetical protein